MKPDKFNRFNYMATQQESQGLDEIQQLFLCYVTGCHVALSGPPGVGKTTLVEEFSERTGQRLVSRVMGPKVNEALLISYPDLVSENGVSVTRTRPGILARALQDNCIYFADEIDRLTEDNQKLHNSAFDDRRSVTMRDGTIVKGTDDFFGILAYNPGESLKNDLEPALADRFVHMNFNYFKPEIEAMVTLKKAGLPLINPDKNRIRMKAIYFRNDDTRTLQFFDIASLNGKPHLVHPHADIVQALNDKTLKRHKQNLFLYFAYENGPQLRKTGYTSLHDLATEQLGLKLAEFCNDIRSLVNNNLQELDSNFLVELKQQNDHLELNNIRLHLPSSRIQHAALKQYDFMTRKMKFPKEQAQIHAIKLIINQVAFGKFGLRKFGKMTNRELLLSLAAAKGLLPIKKQTGLGLKSNPNSKRKPLQRCISR
jgi:MoxR-like ATPase